MLEGVTISESKTQKDELIIEGTDVQNVSQSGMSVMTLTQVCLMTTVDSCIHPWRLPCTEQGYP